MNGCTRYVRSVRVTTKRSAVVTRTESGAEPAVWGQFLQGCMNAAWMTVWRDRKNLAYREMTNSRYLPILVMQKQFYPWSLRVQWRPGTSRIVKQVHTAISNEVPSIHLPHQNRPQGLISPAGVSLLFNSRAPCSAIAFGNGFAVLIFHNLRIFLRPFEKEVYHTSMNARLRACWFAWIHSLPGRNHVASDQAHSGCMGVVSHDRSARP